VRPESNKLHDVSLEPGRDLLHYRLVEKIGEGGMGVVWKAIDTTLERDVAIKVLPAGVAARPEQLQRFEREAKLLASLDHPNIASVRSFHDADGLRFIEMELVDGEDLAQRLARGPLPPDEVRTLGIQVAAALEAAHEQGVVHRDLKPANIKLTSDGKVKVLDFGLAKALADGPSGGDRATSPTVTSGGTLAGVILGTAAYMSPEQARAQPVDRRTDIWSFGCVLYECLTGRRAFAGNTTGDAISSVLGSEPDLASLPRGTPRSMVRLLRRCLAKNVQQRLRDIGDARIELEEPETSFDDVSGAGPTPSQRSLKKQRTALITIAAVLLVTLAIVAFLPRAADTPVDVLQNAHWRIRLPEGSILDWQRTSANLSKLGGGSPLLTLTPDGETVVFSVARDGGSRLHRQGLDDLDSEPIDGTSGARGPFVSPDGHWVGFLADNALQVAPIEGGGARRVCEISSQNFAGGWAADGDIIYSTNRGLWRVPVQGGEPELLAAPDRARGDGEFSLSSVLKDGSGVLFTTGTAERARVGFLDLRSGEWTTVLAAAAHATYAASGHLIYAHEKTLWSVRFDPARGDVEGSPTPLPLDDVHTTLGAGGSPVAHFAVADNGVLVYVPDPQRPSMGTLEWVDRAGNAKQLVSGPGRWEHPRVSPDQQRIAFDILDARGKDVYIYEIGRDQLNRLTGDGSSTSGAWSRDGSRVLGSDLASNGIVSVASDFSGDVRRIPNAGHTTVGSVTPDGRTLIYTERDDQAANWAIGRIRVDLPDAPPERLLRSEPTARWPALSPDGRWLAYVADERDSRELFVRPYPALDRRTKISSSGGGEPVWSGDGSELFYRQDDRVYAVTMDYEGGLQPGVPRALFDDPYDSEPGGHQHWDVARDGRHFAMIRNEEAASSELRVAVGVLPEGPRR
jgi:serine/threonine-protein kinase